MNAKQETEQEQKEEHRQVKTDKWIQGDRNKIKSECSRAEIE